MFAPKISNEVLEMTTSGTMFVAKITILFELTMLFGEKVVFFILLRLNMITAAKIEFSYAKYPPR